MPTRRIPSSKSRDDDEPRGRSSRARTRDDYDEVNGDDDYDEPRGRRSRDVEEVEEPRRSRRSRPRDDDDDEPPTRRTRARDEDEDDRDEPRSRRSRRSRDDDDDRDEPRSRRSRSRDDDDDEPRPRRKEMKSGWGAAERARDANSDWASEVKLSSDEQVFLFLDDSPFVVYGQHWIDERKGKKSFVCLNDVDARVKPGVCPLCDIGDKARPMAAFNVVLLEEKNDPTLQVLVCGPKMTGQLKDKNDSRQGPLTEGYWGLSRSGKGGNTAYGIIPIKERDLESDWGVEPPDDRDIEDLAKEEAYTSKTYPENPPSLRDLKEIAAEIEE